jgi:hypothetical protein
MGSLERQSTWIYFFGEKSKVLGQVFLLSQYLCTSALLGIFIIVRVTDNEPFVGWSSV